MVLSDVPRGPMFDVMNNSFLRGHDRRVRPGRSFSGTPQESLTIDAERGALMEL